MAAWLVGTSVIAARTNLNGAVPVLPDAALSHAALTQTMLQLQFRLSVVEGQRRDATVPVLPAGTVNNTLPVIAALLEIRERLARGGPFTGPLAILRLAAPRAAASERLVDVLAVQASAGVATASGLQADFDRLLPVLDEQLARSEGSLLASVEDAARYLFSHLGFTEPSTPAPSRRALELLKATVARGDMAGAFAVATTLPEAGRSVIAGWVAVARVRIDVEQAVEALSAQAWTALLERP